MSLRRFLQTVDSLEVIVSDNASDDETIEVLREFDDERLSVIRQPQNIGAIGNWNACLSAANGKYVTMLSDDDSVASFFLERCNTLITDDVDLRLIVTLGDVFDGPTGSRDPLLGVESCDLGYGKEQRYSRSSFAATFHRKCVR